MSASALGDRLRAAALATLLLASALFIACGGGSDDDTGDPESTDEPEEQVQAQPEATPYSGTASEAVESFDPEDVDESIVRLNDIIAADATELSELAPHLEAEDPDERWAALYVVAFRAETEEDIELLTPVLEDDDARFRVIAAASLFGIGVTDAGLVLIEGLSVDEALPYSHPPRPVSELATEALEYYTGETHDGAAAWQDWWDENGDSLTWDGEMYADS